MALMRALKALSGTAETLASISWPIRSGENLGNAVVRLRPVNPP
jgi:hypothetical protein